MWTNLLVAPLATAIGYGLARLIADETQEYNNWFVVFAAILLVISVVFSPSLLIAVPAALLAIYAIKTLQTWLVVLTFSALLIFSSLNSLIGLFVAILPVTAYYVHHNKAQHLWYIGILPTLISALALLF